MTQQPWPTSAPVWGAVPGQPGTSPRPSGTGNGLKAVLIGVALVLALGFFAYGLTTFLTRSEEPAPLPAGTPTPEPPAVVPEPDPNPPEVPIPKTWDEADAWVLENPFYLQTAAPVNCAIGRIDPVTASKAALEEHLGRVVGCLTAAWKPPVEAAGFLLPRPPLVVYDTPVTSACGDTDIYNASYCAGDQRIYYSQLFHRVMPASVLERPFWTDEVIAHEFGHTLQARTGILVAAHALAESNSDQAGKDLGIRRLEQQADCWAAMGITQLAAASGITEAELVDLRQVAFASGDDQLSGKAGFVGNHGSGEARQRWFTTGQTTTGIGACNTFAAPADQVN